MKIRTARKPLSQLREEALARGRKEKAERGRLEERLQARSRVRRKKLPSHHPLRSYRSIQAVRRQVIKDKA